MRAYLHKLVKFAPAEAISKRPAPLSHFLTLLLPPHCTPGASTGRWKKPKASGKDALVRQCVWRTGRWKKPKAGGKDAVSKAQRSEDSLKDEMCSHPL